LHLPHQRRTFRGAHLLELLQSLCETTFHGTPEIFFVLLFFGSPGDFRRCRDNSRQAK